MSYKANLTLSSHAGKGLKVSHNTGNDNEANHFLTLCDAADAIEVEVSRQNHSSSLFLAEGLGEYQTTLTVVDHEFNTYAEMAFHCNKRELRQQMVVNRDLTVSPSCCPTCVLGLNDKDNIVLVPKDHEKKLIFDALKPQYNHEELKVMPLVPTSHPSIGIVIADLKRQHGHGRETLLELGDPQKAVRVFIDQDDHIQNADSLCQSFDAYEHQTRPLIFFRKDFGYPHQKFTLNEDGTIALDIDPMYVLGSNEEGTRPIFVKKGSNSQFVFSNLREKLGAVESHAKKQAAHDDYVNGIASMEKRTQGYTLANGVEARMSNTLDTKHNSKEEVYEWPSDEYLGSLTKEQLEAFCIEKAKFRFEEGKGGILCTSIRFESNDPNMKESPLKNNFEPEHQEIDLSGKRVAHISMNGSRWLNTFEFKDDLENTIGSKMGRESKRLFFQHPDIDIGLDEKIVGFGALKQRSVAIHSRYWKIWYKIVKCKQAGIDYDSLKAQKDVITQKKEAEKKRIQDAIDAMKLTETDTVYLIEKHTGENFVQHNLKDGTYIAYHDGTESVVDRGNWRIRGNIYEEKYESEKWSGKINITNGDEMTIDFMAAEHGYHKYTRTTKKYECGLSEDKIKQIEQESKDLQWYLIRYADFCGGDASHEHVDSFEKAARKVLASKKRSDIAYQWWKGFPGFFTKPTGRSATWTNEHTKNSNEGHLFVCATPTGIEANGRILIKMRNVDCGGGPSDGHIDYGISEEETAIKMIKDYQNTDIAYEWHSPSQRLIEKDPAKGQGKWCDTPGVFFMWADQHITEDNLTLPEVSKADAQKEEGSNSQSVKIEDYKTVYQVMLAQQWHTSDRKKITFNENGQSECKKFNWIVSPNGQVIVNGESSSQYSMVWSCPSMTLVDGNQQVFASTSQEGAKKKEEKKKAKKSENQPDGTSANADSQLSVFWPEHSSFQHPDEASENKQRFSFATPLIGPTEYLFDEPALVGPKSGKLHESLSSSQFKNLRLTKVQWREYYGNGIVEGLQFTFSDGTETRKFGESIRYPHEGSIDFPEDRPVASICVCHDDRYVTGLKFFDRLGRQIGATAGKPGKNGAEGETKETFIGLKHGQVISGVSVKQGKDKHDPHAFMIGQVGFIISYLGTKPCPSEDFWSFGPCLSYKMQQKLADHNDCRLMTIEEARQLLKEQTNGWALFPGTDSWAAVTNKGQEDWIQIGDKHHNPGISHRDNFGYPGWGPEDNHFEWRNVALFKKQTQGGEEEE